MVNSYFAGAGPDDALSGVHAGSELGGLAGAGRVGTEGAGRDGTGGRGGSAPPDTGLNS
jgi:hypothetical protein